MLHKRQYMHIQSLVDVVTVTACTGSALIIKASDPYADTPEGCKQYRQVPLRGMQQPAASRHLEPALVALLTCNLNTSCAKQELVCAANPCTVPSLHNLSVCRLEVRVLTAWQDRSRSLWATDVPGLAGCCHLVFGHTPQQVWWIHTLCMQQLRAYIAPT